MYIAIIKSKTKQIYQEVENFTAAISVLSQMMEKQSGIEEALILEESEYLDSNFPDFASCKVIASLRTVK